MSFSSLRKSMRKKFLKKVMEAAVEVQPPSIEGQLWKAAKEFDHDTVRKLLQDPDISVNWGNDQWDNWTSLHIACRFGHLAAVKELLNHPKIDVNQQNDYGSTPLLLACRNGQTEVVECLLKDPRVQLNREDYHGATPLWHAASNGHLKVIQWIIACGQDVVVYPRWAVSRYPLAAARDNGEFAVYELLHAFLDNPHDTRQAVRGLLGFTAERTGAELFALTVFHCDEYVALKSLPPGCVRKEHQDAVRFFQISRRLPIELQMVLCNRAAGLGKDLVAKSDSEKAFKDMAVTICDAEH